MTTELLDQHSSIRDQMDGFMREENTDLCCDESNGSGWVERKKSIVGHIDILLQQMQNETSVDSMHPGPIRELRDQVMQKLLNLLLLSRENEHLLHKNSMPQRLVPVYPTTRSTATRSVYQNV